MDIRINKRGTIKNGKHKNWNILIEDDSENTGGFLILTFNDNEGYDNWVENYELLKQLIKHQGYIIEWKE